MGTGTLLRVQHSGFAGHADQAMGHHQGWSASLEWLRDFVENKVTVETRKPR
jgi:Activator of Hsp90 ATPase homolog 1-like protein